MSINIHEAAATMRQINDQHEATIKQMRELSVRIDILVARHKNAVGRFSRVIDIRQRWPFNRRAKRLMDRIESRIQMVSNELDCLFAESDRLSKASKWWTRQTSEVYKAATGTDPFS